jgi:hypothetical protein
LIDQVKDDHLKKCLHKFRENTKQIDAVQDNGDTMLQMVARFDELEVLTALLKAGANPNAEGRYKRTPLNSAILDCDIIQALIDGGADVNHQDEDGYTPLHRFLVLRSDEYDAVAIQKIIMLIAGHPNVNINLKNNFGQTPLAYFLGCFVENPGAHLVRTRPLLSEETKKLLMAGTHPIDDYREKIIDLMKKHGAQT